MSQPLVMSFRPDAAEMCLDGRKTMTRRIAFDVDLNPRGQHGAIYRRYKSGNVGTVWRVLRPIAIKASRTGKGLGKVLCTGLRVERVQDITEEDARREGVEPDGVFESRPGYYPRTVRSYRDGFENVWRSLYPTGPKSWDADPLVVVIEFEPIEEIAVVSNG